MRGTPLKRFAAWCAMPLAALTIALASAAALNWAIDSLGVSSDAAMALLLAVIALSVAVLWWALALKVGWKGAALAGLAIVVFLGSWIAYNSMVWRDAQYWRAVNEFNQAVPIASHPAPDNSHIDEWDADIAIRDVTANLRASSVMSTASVHYSDEDSRRNLFTYQDYTGVSDVRRHGAILYVLRGITLIFTEHV